MKELLSPVLPPPSTHPSLAVDFPDEDNEIDDRVQLWQLGTKLRLSISGGKGALELAE